MMLQNTESLFDELSRAEITFKPGLPIREYSLLDLEDERTNLVFNGTATVAEYRSRLLKLHTQFKLDLLALSAGEVGYQLEHLRHLRIRIKELALILHPINEEILFAQISFPKYSKRIQPTADLDLVKKKPIYS
jgi:hypothetical protein